MGRRQLGAVAVIVEDAAQLAKIDAVRGALPALRTLFVVEVATPSTV